MHKIKENIKHSIDTYLKKSGVESAALFDKGVTLSSHDVEMLHDLLISIRLQVEVI